MNNRGMVTMKFNKKILVPPIEIDSESDERELQEEKEDDSELRTKPFRIKIEDFLRLKVDYDDYYEYLNKEITSYAAISVDEYTLEFQVEFAKPSDISSDLSQPDYLLIEFIMRELLIDVQNFQSISETKTKNQVRIDR